MLKVVGHLDRVGASPAEREAITNRVIVDALRRQTRADFALNPGDSGFEVFRHKNVTLYDLHAILPFKNNVVTASLTGAEIQAMRKASANTVVSGDIKHLDMMKTYKVACVDYPAKAAYNLPPDKIVDTGRDLRDLIAADLSRSSLNAFDRPRPKSSFLRDIARR